MPNLNLKFSFEAKLAFVANYVYINLTLHMINTEVIAWLLLKLRFNFTCVFKVSQIPLVASRLDIFDTEHSSSIIE